MIYQNQIGDANLAEVHAERVHPEMIEPLRIAGGDMAGDAFVKTEAGEQTKRGGEPLHAVTALFGGRGKDGRARGAVHESTARWRGGRGRWVRHGDLREKKNWREELCLSGERLGREMRRSEVQAERASVDVEMLRCAQHDSVPAEGPIQQGILGLLQRKTPRADRGVTENGRSAGKTKLLLRLGRRSRRSRLRCRRLLLRGCSRLYRIGRVVKTNDVLGEIDLRVENRIALGGRIQDHGITVLASVAVEHVDHLAADAVDHLALRGVDVFLEFRLLAIHLLR